MWKNTGYYMLFFLAGLAGIPQDFIDAAKIDGAGAWQRFVRITLPLLVPTLGFVSVIAIAERADPGGPRHRHDPGRAVRRHRRWCCIYIYQQAQQNYDIGLASAATVVSVALLFALSMVSLRTLERGIHYESVRRAC